MKLGDIYFWPTDQARGHNNRNKYHLFICVGDWQEDNTFLFISSRDYGGPDYRILKSDYSFLTKCESYISCTETVCYSDDELKRDDIQFVGRLTDEHISDLRNYILDSDIMEQRHINRICRAIADYLK